MQEKIEDRLFCLLEENHNHIFTDLDKDMNKQELISQIEWIIEGLDVGDNIFKIVQDIDNLVKKEKNSKINNIK